MEKKNSNQNQQSDPEVAGSSVDEPLSDRTEASTAGTQSPDLEDLLRTGSFVDGPEPSNKTEESTKDQYDVIPIEPSGANLDFEAEKILEPASSSTDTRKRKGDPIEGTSEQVMLIELKEPANKRNTKRLTEPISPQLKSNIQNHLTMLTEHLENAESRLAKAKDAKETILALMNAKI